MEPSCLGFTIECATLWKGAGVTIMGFTLFIFSTFLMLSAIFGRWLGFLVIMVSLSGWMVLLSSLWLFGFWSQGLETPTNLGPRGAEPAWIALEAANDETSDRYETFASWPEDPWAEPEASNADVQSAGGAVTTFLAEKTNEELGIEETAPTAIQGSQFAIDSIRFAEGGGTKLAVIQSHFTGGGPLWTVSLYYDTGSVPRYSYMFLGGSIVAFGLFLPLLDRAEKKRKEFLTGGGAPAWYGPA
ncbi:MAG: hypothetical protein M3Q20_02775 [Actinomycetota bacterium]|nr:hypothetical protein [Actinomycetota bacterium]